MADLTITAANVVRGTGAVIETGVAGASALAGKTVYKDTTDGDKFKLCDADGATALIRTTYGIALHAAEPNQPLTVLKDGPITIGATVAVGTIYCQSNTPGGIMPAADLSTGEFTTIIGIATSASVINVKLNSGGVAFA